MMKKIASFVMQGGRQATIVVATFAILSLLIPPLMLLSTAALCLVTLREGFSNGLRVVIGSSVATALLGLVLLGTPLIALTYLCLMWLPALFSSTVLRETRQLRHAVQSLVVLGVIAVIGIYISTDNVALMWQEGLQGAMAQMEPEQGVTLDEVNVLIAQWSQYMTGLAIAGAVLSLLLSLMIGRWWQGLLFNPEGFEKEYQSLRLAPIDGVAFIVVFLLAAAFDGALAEVMWNIDIQLLVLFLIAGMSVVHVIIKGLNWGGLGLFFLYVIVFFVPYLMVLIILIGLSDVWVNWRERFKRSV